MNTEYVKHVDRWLKEINVSNIIARDLTIAITVRDFDGKPSPQGLHSINGFLNNFSHQWEVITKKLCELNQGIENEAIKISVADRGFLYAPSIIGPDEYELMFLIDLESDIVQQQTCIFCFEDKELILAKKQI